MLTFLSPLLLIGMISAAIPLIIHLSRSRRTKKMRFSTTRFFTDQFLRSYRMSRLKELLLLACRMALCALLAMAFAQPLLLPKGQAFLGNKSRSVVLVIDNSASMGYADKDGRNQLDRARDVARELIDGLHTNDTVSVVLAADHAGGPTVLADKKGHADLGDVLQDIKVLPVATLGTDLTTALIKAEEIVQSSGEDSKEVYILSDMQKSGWLLNKNLLSRPGSNVLFFFVSLRPKSVSNIAVTAVQYQAPRPMVGVPFSIRPHLISQGDAAQTTLVSLYIYDKDGKAEKVAERTAEKMQSGRWSSPRFYHRFTTGGWHAGYVEIHDENLTQDNRRCFALQVLDSLDVLAINGAPSQLRENDELLFLRAALEAANPEGQRSIQVVPGSPGDLANQDLSKYPVVVLANVNRLADEAVKKLEDYVDAGGSLLVFLGEKVDPQFYNENLAGESRRGGGLLPAKLGSELSGRDAAAKKGEEVKQEGSYAAIANLEYAHPALAPFEDPKHGNLASVTFKSLWELKPQGGQSAVLMSVRVLPKDDKDAKPAAAVPHLPLLCEKNFGKGRVMLFASTCNKRWTNFPARPAFLPWTHLVFSYLAQRPLHHRRDLGAEGFFETGDAVPVPVSLVEGMPPVMVKKPDGNMSYATMSNNPDQPLEITDTVQTGIYTLFPDLKIRTQLFAVNLPSVESDLTYLDDELGGPAEAGSSKERTEKIEAGLKNLLPSRPLVYFIADPADVSDVSLSARRGIKLWDIVLWAVLILVLFEPWLANRISMRHYARPRDLPEAVATRGGRGGRLAVEPEAVPAQQEVSSL
jgi:hypothetical protein